MEAQHVGIDAAVDQAQHTLNLDPIHKLTIGRLGRFLRVRRQNLFLRFINSRNARFPKQYNFRGVRARKITRGSSRRYL